MRHDRITVVAIAATSAVLSSVTHELLGHGAGCMLAGGRVTGFSTSMSLCDSDPTSIGLAMLFYLGGSIANLLLGSISLAWARHVGAADRRYALWAFGTWQIWMTATYLILDGIFAFGDLSDALGLVGAPLGGRAVGVAIGALLLLGTRRKILSILSGLVGTRDEARWLCAAPWVAGHLGVLVPSIVVGATSRRMMVAGLLYQGLCGAAPVVLPGLASIPESADAATIVRRPAWLFLAAVAALSTWIFLSRGLTW